MGSDELIAALEAMLHARLSNEDEIIRQALTRLHAQVPEGWVVVPAEPTREMVEAGILFGNSPNKAAIIYQNMLSAAPTPQKGVSDG